MLQQLWLPSWPWCLNEKLLPQLQSLQHKPRVVANAITLVLQMQASRSQNQTILSQHGLLRG